MPLHPVTFGLIALVAALHAMFLVLEMFLWERPIGRRIFRTTAEDARAGAVLAKNQGLYNGFLAAGLVVGLRDAGTPSGNAFIVFFLGAVIIAGLYGAATASRGILFIQALPAAAALTSYSLLG
ncbi:MAG: DUF1304 domain-containing protein [Deltaproteobacteria bacterium]|nr:DUF1304 domain-containing protein [Deltaproteobacteria bacterium]MCB9786669.1 DUF1304 domain-containing protein [Deltaproteobacteria bacterium]